MFNRLTLLCYCLITLFLINTAYAQEDIKAELSVIKQIEVRGNKRIEASTILTRIKTKEGDTYSAERTREDLKTLFNTDYFDDIKFETEASDGNIKLVISVKERAILKDINFDGNDKVTTERLKEKITLISGTPFSNKQVKESVERIKALYQEDGYYDASITPVISKITEDKASVTFLIKEGKKIKIKEVRILGTEKISEYKINKAINTKRYKRLTSWLSGTGIYKEIEAEGDIDRIREYYLDRGYIHVQVSGPEIEVIEGGRWMRIIFRVNEGEKFRVRNIDFKGNDIFANNIIEKKITLNKGMVFSRRQLREDISKVIDLYGEGGYAFANVNPDLRPDEVSREVDITLNIEKGEKIKVRRINIGGNEKTRDKVIRREIRLNELDYLNTTALKRSFQRINNLNYFENIEIVPELVTKDMVDLNVKVKEKPTGAFSMGGGYSSVYGLVAMVDLTEGNLFGKGELLKLKGEFGKLRTSYDLTFKEPWFLDTPTSLTTNIFDTVRSFNSYDINTRGANVGVGRSYGEYWSGGVSYGIQTINVKGTPPPSLSKGASRTASVTTYGTRDTRDNYWDPRSGTKNNASVEYADQFLGGDNVFVKYTLDTVWYYPLVLDSAFMVHGRYAAGQGLRGNEFPANERFYVGGIYTVRGFDYGKASTTSTIDPKTGDLLGADKELIINAEYIIPLVKEARINGVLFYDAGSGFGKDDSVALSDLRTSVGGGFRWLSPIGPLRLEWGYNLKPKPGERQGIWEFSIGTLF
ncbi:MAG: outer membrane protein assembly factor BamA [Nitrospirae bacterium]|nr:outer membrane protein assembly factor BamA [Nitrospirota bacterium]